MDIKEGQLVNVMYLFCVETGRLISTNKSYNFDSYHKRDFSIRKLSTWIRVKFIDLDGTFIGEVERVERNRWSEVDVVIFEIAEQARIDVDRVSGIEDLQKDFCYSDNVTQCDCPGLCRDK